MSLVYLATCAALPNLAAEDAPLLSALRELEVRAEVVVWDSPTVDWARADLCVVRTTWDYHLKRPAFLAWARRVAQQCRLLNPLSVIEWNSEKTYLRDLADRGFPSIPTEWLSQGEAIDLPDLLSTRGWNEAVVKPVIAASAYQTLRVNEATRGDAQRHLDQLLEEQGALVQPYLSSVETNGERALVFIDGEFSHAVRKSPALATNGSARKAVSPVTVSIEEYQLASRLVQTIAPLPLYARVDLVQGDAGWLVMEFELVEPSLYLDGSAAGTARFARAIARRLALSEK